MVTKITNGKTQPAIVMDKLHIDSFTLKQEREPDSKKIIGMSGVLYGFDGDNNMIFDNETFGVSDTDIQKTIALTAASNGSTIEQFMTDYAAAKAKISMDYADGMLSDAHLMACFEMALGRIFEIHGKLSLSNIE